MAVRFELPEDIEHHLEKQWGNLPRHALETLAIDHSRCNMLVKRFDCHYPVYHGVRCAVDTTHTALADHFFDSIVPCGIEGCAMTSPARATALASSSVAANATRARRFTEAA